MASLTPSLPKSLKDSLDSTEVDYVQLGESGLRVSVPVLGGMSFGSKSWAEWVIEEDEALELLKAAYDKGLNTWDTANVYSDGKSEEIIGKALRKFKIPRHKVVIMTKAFCGVSEEPDTAWIYHAEQMKKSKDYMNQYGLSRGAIFHQVEASLARLQTSYIDLLQIHRYDATVPPAETMKALHDLVQSGKVRYIGASSMWAYQFSRLQTVAEQRNWTRFISMQNHYNLCYREEEREMNKYCQETGVGLIPWSPLFGGRLARPLDHQPTIRSSQRGRMNPPLSDADKAIIGRVKELAEKKGWTMSQVSLVWLRAKSTVPIVGFNKVERLEEACGVRGKALTDEEIKYLEEQYVPKAVVGHA